MYPVNTLSITDTTDGIHIIKESRFIYIRPINKVTTLDIYNCSNIIGLGNVVHKGGQVVVKIPNSLLILFIGDNFPPGVSTFHRVDRSYLSNL